MINGGGGGGGGGQDGAANLQPKPINRKIRNRPRLVLNQTSVS
jgi:hypothetical protein